MNSEAPLDRQTRNRLFAGVAVLGAVIGLVTLTRAQFHDTVNALGVDLRHPDILVRSARLSDLPKDLVNAPLLKGVLTNEVVHYYEDHPTRLSLLGTLKRLAFEHELSWSDRLIASAIDAPAELAFWRDAKGRPEHFVLVLQRNVAARAMEQLGKVALPDKQLTVAGEVAGHKVYALAINQRNTWLVVSSGDRLVILSNPGLLLEASGGLSREPHLVVEALLKSPDTEPTAFAKDQGLPALAAGIKQEITARSDYLSFGYQHFFPGLEALRVASDTQGHWHFHARVQPPVLKAWRAGAGTLWNALPRACAVAAALPMDWQRAGQVTEALGDGAQDLTGQLMPTAAVCWGSAGGLYAPVLAAQFQADPGVTQDKALKLLMGQASRNTALKPIEPGREADMTPGPVLEKNLAAPIHGRLWTRVIPHELGAVRQGGTRVNVVAMARLGGTVLASVDQRALEPALAVARKTYPALADATVQGVPVLTINAPELAKMIDAETWRTLQPGVVPTFYRVAKELLPERLQALQRLGTVQVALPVDAKLAAAGAGAESTEARWVDLSVTVQPSRLKAAPTP
jgi:uncharacterized protein YfaA (DUF2138 family)